jgi:hypothetical protein
MNFFGYLEQYALASLEKQDKLGFLLDDRLHELDIESGKMRFSAREIPVQAIGTESDNTLTWLWAWADEQTEIAPSLLQSAIQLRTWGGSNNIPEFVHPSVDLSQADGNAISLISTQVCNASAFFRDEYDGGSAYLLLFDSAIDSQPGFDQQRLIRSMVDLFIRYDLNHRNAVHSYCNSTGLEHVAEGHAINFMLATGERMATEFDSGGRLVALNGAAFVLS